MTLLNEQLLQGAYTVSLIAPSPVAHFMHRPQHARMSVLSVRPDSSMVCVPCDLCRVP